MEVLRCERCFHATPSSPLDCSVVEGVLLNKDIPCESGEDSVTFYVRKRRGSFAPVDTPRPHGRERPLFTVTVRDDGELHFTTAESVNYNQLVDVVNYVFDDVLGELNVVDYTGYPVLHYRRRSHPVVSFEYIRRLYGVLPETGHSVERFERTVDGARYVITANGNIYPVVAQDGTADLNAVVDDINRRIDEQTAPIEASYSIPHVRNSWIRPVTALHPEGAAFVQAMQDTDAEATLNTSSLSELSENERAVLVTSTVLCLLDALDDLGPKARRDVLESEAYVCRTLRKLLDENGITVSSFVNRQSVISAPLVEQLHDLQRTVQRLKPDVTYGGYHLSRGQQWRVTAPESGETVSVRLVGRDFLSGLERMTNKVWVGRVEDCGNSDLTEGDVIPVLSSQLLELEQGA